MIVQIRDKWRQLSECNRNFDRSMNSTLTAWSLLTRPRLSLKYKPGNLQWILAILPKFLPFSINADEFSHRKTSTEFRRSFMYIFLSLKKSILYSHIWFIGIHTRVPYSKYRHKIEELLPFVRLIEKNITLHYLQSMRIFQFQNTKVILAFSK